MVALHVYAKHIQTEFLGGYSTLWLLQSIKTQSAQSVESRLTNEMQMSILKSAEQLCRSH